MKDTCRSQSDVFAHFSSGAVEPLKVGSTRRGEDGDVYLYAVYDRFEAEASWRELTSMPFSHVEDGDRDARQRFAEHLSGLTRDYNGPGMSFSGSPGVRIYDRKVLVIQHCGYDI